MLDEHNGDFSQTVEADKAESISAAASQSTDIEAETAAAVLVTHQPEVTISVRRIIELVLRSGSIDNRYGGSDRAQEGSRIHRRLQKMAGEGYQREVKLSHTCVYEGVRYTVEGRADGVIDADGSVIIDEIKTTAYPFHMVDENFNEMHWSQAKCYGYIYATDHDLTEITLQLTYFQVDTEELKRFQRKYSYRELSDFYLDLLSRYKRWADYQNAWREVRDRSARALAFPFSAYREGQRTLAVGTYRTIQQHGKLYVQAPTGIGKTMSTLFPSVKAVGEGVAEKIFYLTAKTITRRAAEDAFDHMRQQGLRFKTVTLTAKDKICFQEQRECNPDACPFADGYYDRADDAVYELLGQCDHMTRDVIEDCARRYQICPYEFSLDLTLWCDCIICDYNYLFDPVVYLRRFFTEPGDYVFLIDEAHNLVDRAREMYSARLVKSPIPSLRRAVKPVSAKLYRALGTLNKLLIELRNRCGEAGYFVQKEMLDEVKYCLIGLAETFEEELAEHPDLPPELLDYYFGVLQYQLIAELYDERYVTLVEAAGKEVLVKLCCIDPSHLIGEALQRGIAAVFFSATLTPLPYFSALLGGGEEAKLAALHSPFLRDNLLLLAADRISTKYRNRAESYRPIADMIHAVAKGKKGHYLVFFPSYQYLTDVLEAFRNVYSEMEVLAQESRMDEAAREIFLSRFEAEGEEALIGFCVLGGIFSEGIDLAGDKLLGAVVVGVGLPQINRELDVIRDYFDEKESAGFAYAYQYPGMNKVLQAAGRVIRGPSDRGIVLLIDDRFGTARYRALYPEHWSHIRPVRSREALEREVAAFWRSDCTDESHRLG